jgi:hypothetical protein
MSFFDADDDYYSGLPATAEAIQGAEGSLGVKLPGSYVDLLGERNGGRPRARCFPTPFATSWAPDHIGIDAILAWVWVASGESTAPTAAATTW